MPFLAIGVGVAISQNLNQSRLAEAGRRGEGIVLIKSYDPENSKTYTVTYRFQAASGSPIQATSPVDGAQWDRLVERGPIPVTYLPDRPNVVRVAGEKADVLLPLIFAILGGVLSLIGGFVFTLGLRKARRRR